MFPTCHARKNYWKAAFLGVRGCHFRKVLAASQKQRNVSSPSRIPLMLQLVTLDPMPVTSAALVHVQSQEWVWRRKEMGLTVRTDSNQLMTPCSVCFTVMCVLFVLMYNFIQNISRSGD